MKTVTVKKAWEAEKTSGSRSDGSKGDAYVNKITGHRYFAQSKNDAKVNRFTGFNLTDCEVCGCACLQGNSIGYVHTREEMINDFGMLELDRVPEEIAHCEALGECTCMECYEEVE
jgi:hypothetical protein